MEKTASKQPGNYLRQLDLKPAESGNLTLTSIRVPIEVDKQVEVISESHGISKAEVYRRILAETLDNMKFSNQGDENLQPFI